MFYYLEGTVAELLPYLAVVDCGGVGYACKTTNNTLSSLKKGQKGIMHAIFRKNDNMICICTKSCTFFFQIVRTYIITVLLCQLCTCTFNHVFCFHGKAD